MQKISDEIYIDLNYLTENERDTLLQVLARDEEVRKQEKKRIVSLKYELDESRKAEKTKSESEGKSCARCFTPLGRIFNSGAYCPKCSALVCKLCRKDNTATLWLCSLCAKIRQVKAESGAWFYEQGIRKRGDKPQLYGSQLLRASLRRSKAVQGSNKKVYRNEAEDVDEPPSPPVISLQYSHHDKLHKPVAVHMSPLKELTRGDEDEEQNDAYDEVNSNYMFEETEAGQQWSSAFQAYDEGNNGQEDLGYIPDSRNQIVDEADPYQTNSSCMLPLEESYDHMKGYAPNWKTEIEQNGSEGAGVNAVEHSSSTLTPPEVVVIEDNNEVMHEWLEQNGHESNEATNEQKMLLTARADSPDSGATGDYFTPLASPLVSGASSPVEVPQEADSTGSDYDDARDLTPVPEDFTTGEANEHTGRLGHIYQNGSETHDAPKIITQDRSETEWHVTPTIVTPSPSDTAAEMGEGNDKTLSHEDVREREEDIDSFFTEYHSSFGKSSLGEQLSLGSRESIVSYYSGAGQGHYGIVKVTGEIQFGLKYNFRHHKLEVQIHRARDIAAVDPKKGKSDPYVKVYLLPDRTKGGKRKTKIRKSTLNPEFDEILVYKIGYDEMLTRTLWLALWNHDTFGHNDFLGEVMLGLDVYHESGYTWDDPTPQWYPLQEARPEPSLMTYCGEIVLALKYIPPDSIREKKKKKKQGKGELHVCIVEARNLPPKDSNGFSDPFCKSYLLPDTGKKTKQKTPIVRRNLNPKWDFNFVYDNVTLEDLFDRALELSVWDYDRGSTNDFLGGVRLSLGTKKEPWDDAEGEEITAWQSLLDSPNEWHRISLPLRSSLDSRCE